MCCMNPVCVMGEWMWRFRRRQREQEGHDKSRERERFGYDMMEWWASDEERGVPCRVIRVGTKAVMVVMMVLEIGLIGLWACDIWGRQKTIRIHCDHTYCNISQTSPHSPYSYSLCCSHSHFTSQSYLLTLIISLFTAIFWTVINKELYFILLSSSPNIK